MNAHSAQESLLSWLQRVARTPVDEALAGATGWEDVHLVLARFGMEIKPRGAGLALVMRGGKTGVKASELHKGLAFKALTDQFGQYEPPSHTARRVTPDQVYRGGPADGAAAALYADYVRRSAELRAARAEALKILKTQQRAAAEALRRQFAQQHRAVTADPFAPRLGKRLHHSRIASERRAQKEGLAAQKHKAQEQFRQTYKTTSWQDYLRAAAAKGNVDALRMLRRRQRHNERRRAGWSVDAIFAKDRAQAFDWVMTSQSPSVMADGTVLYRLKDGVIVRDQAAAVTADRATREAARLAVVLAMRRFEGQALMVSGSDLFRRLVVQEAAKQGFVGSFADPALQLELEKRLQRRLGERHAATDNLAQMQSSKRNKPRRR